VTMHAVLGDGEMTRKELTETLADIWKADEKAGNTFWFLLQGKAEPTDTDKTLVQWLEKNDIYYEIITDDAANVDPVYSQPQETHEAKRLGQKVVNLFNSKPEEDEPAELLALFASSDPDAAEDRWLNTICQSVFDAKFPIRALNDGLVEVDLSEGAGEAEKEPEEAPGEVAKPTKAVSKKAASGKLDLPDTPVSHEAEVAKAPTRAALEAMDLDGLKEVAARMGITVPARSRMNTYIELILGEAKDPTPVAEVSEEVGAVGGTLDGIDTDAFAEEVANLILTKLIDALKGALNEG